MGNLPLRRVERCDECHGNDFKLHRYGNDALGSGFASVRCQVLMSGITLRGLTPSTSTAISKEIGMNKNGPWDPSEYEMRQDPSRWRTPCTINGNNDCVPNGGTYTFLNRPDANKFYPDPEVPIEEFQASSFTVSKEFQSCDWRRSIYFYYASSRNLYRSDNRYRRGDNLHNDSGSASRLQLSNASS